MKKSMLILVAAASLLHAQEPGTMLLDDATSSTYVVTNAYQNAEFDVKSDIQEEIGRFAETGMVDRANSANTAGNAAYAETAGTADTATHAQTSDTATSAETAQNANSAIYAESADIANEAELSRKSELLVNPEGSAYLELSAQEIKDKLDLILSTNDVCAIVTNTAYGEWQFDGTSYMYEGVSPDGQDHYDIPTTLISLQWFYTTNEIPESAKSILEELQIQINDSILPVRYAVYTINASDVGGGDYLLTNKVAGCANSYSMLNTPTKIELTSDAGDYGFYLTRKEYNALGLARMIDLPPLTNGLIGADFIATNNPAFVSAVTNCPVAIAASDAEALAEWGIYGGGTIGTLLAALAAAVAALKKKKMPLYPVGGTGNPVNATLDSGVLTVAPFAMAAYTPTANAAFSVAMGALPSDMESGKARDAVLVIDCTSLTDGQEPTVTWGVNFHPRTDAGTDFACVAGSKNVYYISEYAVGEFAVGGWQETEGGYAPNGGSGT